MKQKINPGNKIVKNAIKLFLLFLSLSSLSCSDAIEESSPKFNLNFIYTTWFHSYEEQALDGEIYRPYWFKDFTPSRYRRTFKFTTDGKCKVLMLAPTDAHYELSCNWQYDELESAIYISSESGKGIYRLKIIELTGELLKLQTESL